ncbi:MAG: hypothetical protein ACREJB_07005 [Planctomycetaceae bacterium]
MRSSIPSILVGRVERGGAGSARLSERAVFRVEYLGEPYSALALFTSPAAARRFLDRQDRPGWSIMLFDDESLQTCLRSEAVAKAAVIDPPDMTGDGDVSGFFIGDMLGALAKVVPLGELATILSVKFTLRPS